MAYMNQEKKAVIKANLDKMNTTLYEVQHYTICDGWINTWTICDDEGNEIPKRFQSYDEAIFFLNEHLQDCEYSYYEDKLDFLYEANDFRIKEITA